MNTEIEIVKKRPGYVIEKVFEHSGLAIKNLFDWSFHEKNRRNR